MTTQSDNKKHTYFIAGGGTGGHIYPAIAIANALKTDEKTEKIYYIGNPDNLEKKIAEREDFDFLNVEISGMPRKADLKLLSWSYHLFISTVKCIHYIFKYKPDLVFGTGGYVSAPALFAAIITNTPFMIHDCDAIPGIVSKTVAPFAKKISVAFEKSQEFLKSDNVICNGNPIRDDFLKLNKKDARKILELENKLTIVVMGGSQGAQQINSAIANSVKLLFEKYDIQILHQTGAKNYDKTIQELEKIYPEYKENKNYRIQPYFDDMYVPLMASDIAISRSGSLSLSEICISKLASVLIPYPFAAADHQRKNAREMEANGASVYLENDNCNSENLCKILEELINNSEKLAALQNNSAKLAKPDATKNIIKQIYQLV